MTRRTRMWLSLSVLGMLVLDLAALAVAAPYARAWLTGDRAAAVARAGAIAVRGIERAGTRGVEGVASALSIHPAPRGRSDDMLFLRADVRERTCPTTSSCPYARRARLVRTLVLQTTCGDATGAAGAECTGAAGDGHAGSEVAKPGEASTGTTGQATSGGSHTGLPITGLITTMQ